jgi:hypothetical protein
MKPFATALIAIACQISRSGRPTVSLPKLPARFAVKAIQVRHFAGRLGW